MQAIVFFSVQNVRLGQVVIDGTTLKADPLMQSVVDTWRGTAAEFYRHYDGWSNGAVKSRTAVV